MHRASGPWNTGVSHGSSRESPESLSLLSYKGLEDLRRAAAAREGIMQRASVWHGQPGALDSTTGMLCMISGQFVILLPPWAVVRAVLARLQNRGYRNGPGTLATAREATLCSWPPPSSGRGKSLSGCRAVLPHHELSSHPACTE